MAFRTRRDGRVYRKRDHYSEVAGMQEAFVNTVKLDVADRLGPGWRLEQESAFSLVYKNDVTGKFKVFNKFTGKRQQVMSEETLEDLTKGPRREDYR